MGWCWPWPPITGMAGEGSDVVVDWLLGEQLEDGAELRNGEGIDALIVQHHHPRPGGAARVREVSGGRVDEVSAAPGEGPRVPPC